MSRRININKEVWSWVEINCALHSEPEPEPETEATTTFVNSIISKYHYLTYQLLDQEYYIYSLDADAVKVET